MLSHNILQSYIRENGNAWNGSLPTDRYGKMIAFLNKIEPDIIALQECDIYWHDLIDNINNSTTENSLEPFASMGYTLAADLNDSDKGSLRTPIYYKADKFECLIYGIEGYLGSEYKNNAYGFHWCILRDKFNQNTFGVMSTHLIASTDSSATSTKAAQIAQLIKFRNKLHDCYGIPVVIMGDMNTDPSVPAYDKFDIGNTSVSARDSAIEVVGKQYRTTNVITHFPALTDSNGTGVIDHCFTTTDLDLDYYEVMVKSYGTITSYSFSDHVPQLLKFKFKSCSHENWGEVSYEWSSDCSQCTASAICSECGELLTETVQSEPRYISATCTSNGFEDRVATFSKLSKETQYCPNMHRIYPALGHTGGLATCLSPAICTRCQTPYGSVDPNNHASGEWVTYPKIPATCTTAGRTAYQAWSCCGAGETPKVIPSGHTWSEYTWDTNGKPISWQCPVCGTTTNVLPEIG
jgi:endonuclease/exonuclease/phosphatase family metal-dependent hydrolase